MSRFRRDHDEWRFGGSGTIPPFLRDFEDMWKEMDDTFDELFRTFGVDNIPMFDPYIPPSHGNILHCRSYLTYTYFYHSLVSGNAANRSGSEKSPRSLPPDHNVRDRMLKGGHQTLPYVSISITLLATII